MSEDILRGLRRKYPKRRLFERHIVLETRFSTHSSPSNPEYIYGWKLGHTAFLIKRHGDPFAGQNFSLFMWSWCGIARIQGDRLLCEPLRFHSTEVGFDADWVVRIVRPTKRFAAHLFVDVTPAFGQTLRRSMPFYSWSFSYFQENLAETFEREEFEPKEGPDYRPGFFDTQLYHRPGR